MLREDGRRRGDQAESEGRPLPPFYWAAFVLSTDRP